MSKFIKIQPTYLNINDTGAPAYRYINKECIESIYPSKFLARDKDSCAVWITLRKNYAQSTYDDANGYMNAIIVDIFDSDEEANKFIEEFINE